MTHLAKAYIHPVKGCRGQRLTHSFYINSDSQMMGDRQFAFRVKNLDQGNQWAKKQDFLCAMLYPKMACWQARYNTEERSLVFTCKNTGESVTLPHIDLEHNDVFSDHHIEALSRKFGYDAPVHLVGSPWSMGRPLTDQKTTYISVGNLATLRALAKEWHVNEHPDYGIHPARFGINLWLDGFDAFDEWHWVEKQQRIHMYERSFESVILRARKHITRCPKVNASPFTGKRDKLFLKGLLTKAQELGWQVPTDNGLKTLPLLGVFAEVIKPGNAMLNDTVSINP